MSAGRVTADTSVLVPALCSWHEHHAVASRATQGITSYVAQVLVETVSVLSRLPRGLAVDVDVAVGLVLARATTPPLTLAADDVTGLLRTLGTERISGGAVYDALIAATALANDAKLRSLDSRALPVYRAMGVRVELVA